MAEKETIEGMDAVVARLIELSGHPDAWKDVPKDGLAFGIVPPGECFHISKETHKWHNGRLEGCPQCTEEETDALLD